ncbi:MAG: antA/AntB antirepressor family protein [Candidatus Competibacteraceae bacterium]|nr:antA/AntB antirepressor family protein [Candidatus Competibacteraceae bacterium]
MKSKDFEVLLKFGLKPPRGPTRHEYSLSLDMAKELAMVERTDKRAGWRGATSSTASGWRAASKPTSIQAQSPAGRAVCVAARTQT